MHPEKKQPPTPTSKKKPRVSNKVELDATTPVPFDRSGGNYYLSASDPYIPFLFPKDTYASQLAELRTISVTHNACISTKANYCAGVGVIDTNGKELDKSITDWFKGMNLANQGITKVLRQAFNEYYTFGNVPIELVRYTVNGKKHLHIYVHSILEWRLAPPNEFDIPTHAIQSKLFTRDHSVLFNQKDLKRARTLPIYNPFNSDKKNWKSDDNGTERTMIWYKNDFTGFKYYGMPNWIAAFIYALLEYKGARYNMDNFDNNMVVATILALKGSLSDAEVEKIAKKIIRQHSGDGKRGRTVVVASETGQIDGSDLHKLDTKTDGSFVEADEKWSQKIILAHEWDSVLAGVLPPSAMGKGSGFLTKILENKLNTVIRPAQSDLMCEVFSHIFTIAQKWMGLPFDKYELAIKNSIDISGLTDVDITPAVTRNEVREAKGLPKDDSQAGKEYMAATKNKGGENV